MPIYEFRCNACACVQELLQKLNDPSPEICPKCGKTHTMEKLVSQGSFQLKGGGWYSDLYASTKKADAKEAAPASSSEKSAPEKKSEPSS